GRPRRGEPTLSRERVAAAALSLADEQGVEAVTMRRLGAALGVEAMALYTHVRGKDDLLAAAGALLLEELAVEPRERGDWRGRVEAVCSAWAALRAAHPRAFPLVFRAEALLAVTEELMDALETAGFAGAEAWLAYQTLVFFLDPPLLHWPPQPPGEVWERVAARRDAGTAPHLVRLAPHARAYAWDDVYANGVELFLD